MAALRRLLTISALFLTFGSVIGVNPSDLAFPECGLTCYVQICNSTEPVACSCEDTVVDDMLQCVTDSCPGEIDWIVSTRLILFQCDLPRPSWQYDHETYMAVSLIFAVQTLFWIPRVVSRAIGIAPWGWDDAICGSAYILLMARFIIDMTVVYYAPQSQYWYLDFWKQPYGWKLQFASWEIFPFALALCKASILAFYNRIFEGQWIRRLLMGSQVFNVLLALSFFLTKFFVDWPLRCAFELLPESQCTHNDVWDGSGAFSAVNAVFDVWMIAVPAFMVSRLNMSTAKKFKIVAFFATGILTCLAAIFRFVVWRLANSPLPDSFFVNNLGNFVRWGIYFGVQFELTACFAVTCLPPAMQLAGQKVWPFFRSRIASVSSQYRRKSSHGSDATTVVGTGNGSIRKEGTEERSYSKPSKHWV